MFHHRTKSFFLLAVIFVLVVSGFSHPAKPPEKLPRKVLISGVPYISWREAHGLDYASKGILNPSDPATIGMMLLYWGQDLELLKNYDEAIPKEGGWGKTERGEAQDFKTVKSLVAQGIPVLVATSISPYGHPVSPVMWANAAFVGIQLDQPGGSSRMLGVMLPLKRWKKLDKEYKEKAGGSPWESLLSSPRLLIGYDDDRKVTILHAPSFGPAWEVSYKDFGKMWEVRNRYYLAVYPENYEAVLAERGSAPPYRERTPDEQAAERYIYGYSLMAAGDFRKSLKELQAGLAIEGIGPGMMHLLLLESAVGHNFRRDTKKAMALALEASEFVPEHFRPWDFLAWLYGQQSGKDWKEKAAEAQAKAKSLCEGDVYQKKAGRILARHFFLTGCRGDRLMGPGE